MASDNGGGMDLVEVLQQDGVAISSQALLSMPLDKMSTEEVHFGWSLLDLVEKATKARKSDMRARLMDEAQEHGVESDKGHLIMSLPMGTVTMQKRQGKPQVLEANVRSLLESKGIDPSLVFVTRTVEEFSPDAFKALVQGGRVTLGEVEGCKEPGKVTWALKVEKPDMLPKKLGQGA